MPPHRKCNFNEVLQKQYTFLTQTTNCSEVQCRKCMSTFSIANGGKHDIQRHLRSNKHRSADVAASASKITTYVKPRTMDVSGKKSSVNEGTWAYHTVEHNFSFRSNDCTSRLIKRCFDENYSSARTKCEAIISNVLAPNAIQETKAELNAVSFISIYSDCSNHGSTKLCPILVRYFLPQEGIRVKILDVREIPGESSDILKTLILDVLSKFNLSDKMLALCADNTNCNFGGAKRRGQNNVFHKLQTSLGKDLVAVNCAAHILNNCIQSSIECLPIDIEVVVVKIYSYFYIYTVRVEQLKEICNSIDIEYKRLLGFSKTRWLTLKPSIERILKLFKPLKKYFLEQEKCPTILKKIFGNPSAEAWLLFVHCQALLFHVYIAKIESQNISMTEVSLQIKELKIKILERRDQIFIPLAVQKVVSELETTGSNYLKDIKTQVHTFYSNCVDYLNQWDSSYKDVELLQWVLLRSLISWEEVEKSVIFVTEKRKNININDSELFDEIVCIKSYVTGKKLEEWLDSGKFTEDRWVEIFQHLKANCIAFKNTLKLVEFTLSLPGSNAATERVFSIVNNIWTSEKSQMKVETIKSILITKCNYDQNCIEFKQYLEGNDNLIKQIYSAEKYQ